VKYFLKEKIALIFITLYFSLFSDMLLDLFNKNIFGRKYYIVYGVLALLSFLFYKYIGKYNEETIAHEFFSSTFAIALVFLFITIYDPSYDYWLLALYLFFLWSYPFVYLNKCCIHSPGIKDIKRTFNFHNVYIGVLVTTIIYLSQLYTDLNTSSIPMFFVYIFYLSYIFIYVLFMGSHILKNTFPAVDLMIVLLISIFYVMTSSYFLTNKKNKSNKSKLCIEYKIGNDKAYLITQNINEFNIQQYTFIEKKLSLVDRLFRVKERMKV